MLTTSRKTLTAIATVSALAAGGATLAGAAATNSSSSSSSERSQRPAQTALTGEAAVKVRAAAQEKVPDGTVLRVEEGGPESSKYHAHVRRSDGTMLARLEEAFAERRASEERLRRLLTDASHELRTPLASIRGYAELFRIGAAAQPQDVAKAMTRIETSRRGWACSSRTCSRSRAPTRSASRSASPWICVSSPPMPSTTRALSHPIGRSRCRAKRPPSSTAIPASCARCWPTSCATRSCTRRREHRSR